MHDAFIHGQWLPEQCDSYECLQQSPAPSAQFKLQAAEPAPEIKAGTPVRVQNLLEELDAPGEYYLDRNTGYLYVWPLENAQQEPWLLSQTNTLICCDNAAHVCFEGLQLACARVSALEVLDGHAIHIAHCHLCNLGNLGVNVVGGKDHRLEHCTFMHTGDGAVRLEGGHESTAQASGHVVEHCQFEHYSRSGLAYRSGLYLYGYGHVVRENNFRHGYQPAILEFGQHVVERNQEHGGGQ